MTASVIQPSFAAGELSPSFWGHVDHVKFRIGASTMRNMFASIRGGAYSRAGTSFAGKAKQVADASSTPPRIISFQFKVGQSYILEIGDFYIRFLANGGYITETPLHITAATQANPITLTVPGHTYINGDWVFITGALGMTQLNGLFFIISGVAGNTFHLSDTFGNPISSLAFGAYTGAATTARVYTITTPYLAVDLPYLKYIQSADLMSLVLSNPTTNREYAPQDLDRLAPNNWSLTPTSFQTAIAAPASCTAAASAAPSGTLPSAQFAYCVTAIDEATGEESVASPIAYVSSVDISLTTGSITVTWATVAGAASYNIYKAPAAVYINGATAQTVPIGSQFGFVGSAIGTQFVDQNVIQDFSVTPPLHLDPFSPGQIIGITVTNPGSGYTQATAGITINSATGSGGVILPVVVGGAIVAGIVVNPGKNYKSTDTITFTGQTAGSGATATYTVSATDGAIETITVTAGGNSYTSGTTFTVSGGTLGVLVGTIVNGVVTQILIQNAGGGYTAGNVTITDVAPAGTGALGTLQVGSQTGNYPGVVAYFQQRRGYADTLNNPDFYFFSHPGAFTNMDAADPPIDSDAIVGAPWAQQVNGIQWMVPMPVGLVTCTGLDCWQLTGAGGGGAPLTPSSQNANVQESYGFSPTVPPIRIGTHFIYVTALDSTVRDNVFNFFTNTYSGDDLSQLSNHLFDGHQIIQWAWARIPFKIIWAVRDDGVLLSLTYLKEQEIVAWARHDTNGQVVSIAVASEAPVDAVYIVVKRFIPGQNAYGYYVERMDDRIWSNAESCWCVDCGLSLPLPQPNATLTAGAVLGNDVLFTASAPVFDGIVTGAVGQVIRMGGGKAVVTAYNSPMQVTANVLVNITQVVPDIASNLPQIPLPAPVGDWSIATPVTNITGLNHLEGMTVIGLADGAVISPTVVSGGAITLTAPASAVTVGLPFQAQLQSLHLQKQGEEIQDERKKVIGVTVRVEKSRGVKIGANQPNASAQEYGVNVPWGNYPWGKMALIPEQQNQLGPNQYLPLFTGDHYVIIDDDWNTPGQSASPGMIAAQQDFPLPMQVLAFIPKFTTGDTPTP